MQIEDTFEVIHISGGLWKTAPITEEPEIELYNWKIMTTQEGSFFVGDRNDYESRASTDIITFDPETKRGVTASGRVYQLIGKEATYLSGNADYVWGKYKRINRLTDVTTKDLPHVS